MKIKFIKNKKKTAVTDNPENDMCLNTWNHLFPYLKQGFQNLYCV